jgi:hypothetical protein
MIASLLLFGANTSVWAGGRQLPVDTSHEALRHPVRRPGRDGEDQGQNLGRRGGQTAPRQRLP